MLYAMLLLFFCECVQRSVRRCNTAPHIHPILLYDVGFARDSGCPRIRLRRSRSRSIDSLSFLPSTFRSFLLLRFAALLFLFQFLSSFSAPHASSVSYLSYLLRSHAFFPICWPPLCPPLSIPFSPPGPLLLLLPCASFQKIMPAHKRLPPFFNVHSVALICPPPAPHPQLPASHPLLFVLE